MHVCVAQLLQAAVPLLTRLRRPALLLPGPLQVVVKAQRIVLDEGERYEGGTSHLPLTCSRGKV